MRCWLHCAVSVTTDLWKIGIKRRVFDMSDCVIIAWIIISKYLWKMKSTCNPTKAISVHAKHLAWSSFNAAISCSASRSSSSSVKLLVRKVEIFLIFKIGETDHLYFHSHQCHPAVRALCSIVSIVCNRIPLNQVASVRPS